MCVLSKGACPEAISAAIGAKVVGMLAKEHKGYAYAIFDVDGAVDAAAIEKVTDVIKVRVI